MAQPTPSLPSRAMKKDAAYAEQLAWAAGLFEGEGSIAWCGDDFSLQGTNTDLSVLERFVEILELGYIYGPYTRQSKRDSYKRKPFWRWVARREIAFEALELLAPWLSERRLNRAYELARLRFPMETDMSG
jgi:hypothetical protein